MQEAFTTEKAADDDDLFIQRDPKPLRFTCNYVDASLLPPTALIILSSRTFADKYSPPLRGQIDFLPKTQFVTVASVSRDFLIGLSSSSNTF